MSRTVEECQTGQRSLRPELEVARDEQPDLPLLNPIPNLRMVSRREFLELLVSSRSVMRRESPSVGLQVLIDCETGEKLGIREKDLFVSDAMSRS